MLIRYLTDNNPVDQFNLPVNPVVLGVGKRKFAELTNKAELKLTESTRFASDVLYLQYQPV